MKFLSRYVIVLCLLAVPAWAAEEEGIPPDHVTEQDRVWANFNRETAVVGSGNLRLAVRGTLINKSVTDDEPDLTGFSFIDLLQAIDIGNGEAGTCGDRQRDTCAKVKSIDGVRVDVRGAYGLGSTAEIGFNMPFFSESLKFAGDEIPTMNTEDVGDLVFYGKFRKMLSSSTSVGGGLEVMVPTGSERKRLGTGETAFNPFVNIRYTNGRIAVGGHVGFNMSGGNIPDVLNYSTFLIARGNEVVAFRLEFNGRFYRGFGTDFNDLSLWPGLDLRIARAVTVRPQAHVGITHDAWDYGIGLAIVVDVVYVLDIL